MRITRKNIAISGLAAFFLASCAGSGVQDGEVLMETMSVSLKSEYCSRIELGENFETLLNTGDVFSVFHKSPAAEIWFYDGADRASSGEIKHVYNGERVEIYPHIVAVSPFNALNSISYTGGAIVGFEL